jgi:hypothetical protein
MTIWGKQGDVPKKLFTYFQQEQMLIILVLGNHVALESLI